MRLFDYHALDVKGRNRKGQLQAQSEREARQALRDKGLVPRHIQEVVAPNMGRRHSARGRLKMDETITFLQQLATLLEAGMPLVDSLEEIAKGMERKAAAEVIFLLRQRVTEGRPLWSALKHHGFEEIICNMVEAAEETGQLEVVSARLAELLERRRLLRQEVFSASLYPIIVMGFGLVVMSFLLTVVVPQVTSVFTRTGVELPAVTRYLIAVSDGVRKHGYWLLLMIVVLISGYRVVVHKPRVKGVRDRILLRLPGIGGLLTRIETARFSRTLGMLFAGGVPILSALFIAAQTLLLSPLRDSAMRARDAVREGGGVAAELASDGYFPYLAVRLIAVGEQTGRLDEMLLKVADAYEAESSRALKRLITVLEPALVLVMAVMVGGLAMAILLPIMEMNELVR